MDLPVPESWPDAAATLLPVIRRAGEPAHARIAELSDPANRLLRSPFAPHLSEMVVLDLPDVRMFVNAGHLELWGVDAPTAFAAARDNLRDAAAEGLRFREDWGVWHLDSGDGYASSRLCLPGWLAAFAGPVQGAPIAAIPTTGALLVTGDRDLERLELLLDIGRRAWAEAASPLSPVLYTVGGGGVVPWRPAAGHGLAEAVAIGEALLSRG